MSFLNSPLSRRNFSLGALSVTSAALLRPSFAYAAKDLSAVTLRVASFRGMDSTVLPALGLADFPYKVEFSEFNSGNLIAQAINANAIDIGEWSEIPLVFIAASGANVKVVATLDGPTTDQAVMVPNTSQARSFADLKGKKIGYIRSTTTHYFLIKMLEKAGMTLADIIPVPLGMSQGLTALKSGSLDAWATYGYVIPLLENEGSARILESAQNILSGHYFLGANPVKLPDPVFRAAAADYIKRLGKAYNILEHDKARWAKIIAPVIQTPEPVILRNLQEENRPRTTRVWTQNDIASAQAVAQTFAQQRLLPSNLNIAPVFSDALFPELQK